MRIRISARALSHLQQIREYLHGEEAYAEARRVKLALQAAVLILARFPHLGHRSAVPGTFEWVVRGTPYIVVYEILNGLVVLGVYHEAQDR